MRGEAPADWRDSVFSEIDYAFYSAREALDLGASDARGYMIRTDTWKYVHFKGFPPQLFNLADDPDEFVDLGRVPEFASVRQEMHNRLLERLLQRKNRTTMSDTDVLGIRENESRSGIIIGQWQEPEAAE